MSCCGADLEAANQQLERDNEIAAQQLIRPISSRPWVRWLRGLPTISPTQPVLSKGPSPGRGESRGSKTPSLRSSKGIVLRSEQASSRAHNFGELEKGAEDTMLGADRINAINSAIRNQARSEQGLSSVLIRELIDECLTVVGHRLKGIAVEVVCPDDLVVELIRPHFGQVLMNLLSNAADAIVGTVGVRMDGLRSPSKRWVICAARSISTIVAQAFRPSCGPRFKPSSRPRG